MTTKILQPARITLFGCCLLFLFACMGVMKTGIKDDGVQIPPNFGKEDVTLLVIRKDKRSYDKYLEKNFKENYFGKYVIVSEAEVKENQFDDKKQFRYIFSEAKQTDIIGHNRPGDYGQNTYAKFGLTDRLTGQLYQTKNGTGAFSKWMKAYIQELEKTRTKNKSI